MSSLFDDALSLVEKRKALNIKKKTISDKGLEDKRKNIRARLIRDLPKMPVAYELLKAAYVLNNALPYDIVERCNQVEYFRENLGNRSYGLMQTYELQDHGGDEYFDCYCAWAVEFLNVYGLSIYFVPYSYDFNGFACVVIDRRKNIHFFPQDIDRSRAVLWIAEWIS